MKPIEEFGCIHHEPKDPEPTNDEWNLAWEHVVAWGSLATNDGGIDFCNLVSAEAYRRAAERLRRNHDHRS